MLNIIVSPYEINQNGEYYTKRIVKFLKSEKVEYSVYFCKTLEDVGNVSLEICNLGETEFVIVGGDLVLHTFLNSVKDLNKIKLGIVPTSKHDDFASFIGINPHPIKAMRDILEKNIETVDYMLCNDQIVLNNITIGASTEVYELYNNYKIRNALTLKFALMRYGNNFEGINLTLENKSGKGKLEENIFELSIANGGKSKGKDLSPLSNVKDGLFNVNYAVVNKNKKESKKYLKKFLAGKQIYDENTKQKWLNNLHITNEDKKIKALVDGTICNFEEINVSIVEGGLKLYKKFN